MGTGFDYLAVTSTSLPLSAIKSTHSISISYSENITQVIMSPPASSQTSSSTSESISIQHMKLALTVMHLFLVSIGSVNLLVVFVIASRRYMRSITNVYIVSLCMADFLYLANLILVAATQINNKSWPFGQFMCTVYHGTESTGKYASVIFVVLLAADRYCAMCRPNFCARYRNYRIALSLSVLAWVFSLMAAFPLFFYSEDAPFFGRLWQRMCFIRWPSSENARWYIAVSSVLIFAIPLTLIIFFYYHILNKLRNAVKGNKRMRRTSSSRAPYHRVTRLVLWVVIFHVVCWSPFWVFNLFSSIFRLKVITQFDRIILNVIHLFPYLNCALNPLVYAINAENFRRAFRSLFCLSKRRNLSNDSRFATNELTSRSVIAIGMDAANKRLLNIGYASNDRLSIEQECQSTILLNGSIFSLHNAKSGDPSDSSAVNEDQECQRSSGTIVRFATVGPQFDYGKCSALTRTKSELNGCLRARSTELSHNESKRVGSAKTTKASLSDSATNSLSLNSLPNGTIKEEDAECESDVFM